MARTSIFPSQLIPRLFGVHKDPFFLSKQRGAGLQEVFQFLSVRLSIHLFIFLSIPPSLFGLVVSYTANIPQTSGLAELGRQ